MPIDLLSPGQRLRALWALDTTPRPGVSERELVAFEQRAGFPLPAALRDYLLCVEGCDEWLRGLEITFWSLTEIERETREDASAYPHADALAHGFLPFADWMINLVTYAVPLGGPADVPVYLLDGGRYQRKRWVPPILCANSFAEFVTLYETSDGRLFG